MIERVVDDPGHDRPLHVLELQVEVGHVGDEVLARRVAEERAEDLLGHHAVLLRLHDVLQAIHRDFRALHLADERGVGQRVEIRERLDVDAVGLAVEEQRVGLDRVEHRRRDALGDVHVHGTQVLGQDRGRRAVVHADVFVDRRVAGLLGVMVDDQTDAVDRAAEVVRLHVHHRDPIERLDLLQRDDLDVDVEQVHHPLVLRPRHALQRRDDGRLPVAVQHRAERQAAGHRVGIRIVVQEDEHPVGVAEESLILLDAEAGEGAAELGEKRTAEELGEGQVIELGKQRLQLVFTLSRVCEVPTPST